MSIKKIVDYLIYKTAKLSKDLNAEKSLPALPEEKGFNYQAPVNLNALTQEVQSAYLEIIQSKPSIPERHILFYNNAYVSYDGVILRNFRLALPSLDYPGLKKEYLDSYLLKQWINKKISPAKNKAIAVAYDAHATNNYYHWLIETCPRLLLLKENFKDTLLLVPEPTPTFILTTLNLLGFNNLYPIKKNEILKAQQVILPEHAADDNFYSISHQHPLLLQQLQQTILKALNVPKKEPYRRIYVSRAKQKIRRVINEKDFTSLLQKYGFETIYFEELSFKEQVVLMNETAILIGVHGANLANIMFMHPQTRIIEIEDEAWRNFVYFRLANYMNLSYYNIRCKNNLQIEAKNSDVSIDLNNLKLIFSDILT